MAAPRVLVVGAGSAGRRHARNLAGFGCTISGMDPRPDRRDELLAEVEGATVHDDLDAALTEGPDAVVVASPTAFHVEQATAALRAGVPVLLEKPPAVDFAETVRLAEEAAASGVPLLLGYTWRWWPALRRVRELVAGGAVGEVRHVRCTLSAHLEDWHPWEPYQDFFMAHRALGGGALLDESHWIDLAIWCFGAPDAVFASIDRLSDLDIDTDDNVDLTLFYDGLRVVLHLDIHGRPHERSLTISGSEGSIRWSDQPNVVAIGTGPSTWSEEPFADERNDMFVAVAEEFLGVVRGAQAPSCTIADGLAVMRVVDASRESDRTRSQVEVVGA